MFAIHRAGMLLTKAIPAASMTRFDCLVIHSSKGSSAKRMNCVIVLPCTRRIYKMFEYIVSCRFVVGTLSVY
jgi:hypothetical protein